MSNYYSILTKDIVPNNLEITAIFKDFCKNCPRIDLNTDSCIINADGNNYVGVTITCRNLDTCEYVYERALEEKGGANA